MKKVFIFLAALFIALSAQAQTAIVNTNQASQQYWKSLAEQKNLADQSDALTEKARSLQSEYQNIITKMKELDSSLKDSLMLSDDKKAEIEGQIKDLQGQAVEKKQQMDGLKQQFEMMVKKTQALILSDITEAVKTVAKEKGVSVVYDSETVLYAEVDLTEDVVKELNKDAPVQPSN
jgi:Skp family chaperone for outer membrane proteins